MDTWDTYQANAPEEETAFIDGWMEARRTALEDAGLNPVF
jgi:hypothetical protein